MKTLEVKLSFRAANDPPDDEEAVLCTDLEDIWIGYHLAGKWFSVDAAEWTGVIAWAHLPDPLEISSHFWTEQTGKGGKKAA